uniref:Uncharacterized protein n=1 Tax=Salmonella enterica I TaxID=59201 RepID=A0A1P8SIA3_SALET|nr:hypothetical protein KNPOEEDL_00020 [Salmonella enterica subsp. enterica serovar Typhimurium]
MHGSGKLAADALAVRGGAERQALTQSHIRSDAGYLALPQDGEKVAPVEDAAVPAAGGVALFKAKVTALLSVSSLAAKPCGNTAMSMFSYNIQN